MTDMGRQGRFHFPTMLFVYPFYLFWRSPGKTGSHFSPSTDLFASWEAPLVGYWRSLSLSSDPTAVHKWTEVINTHNINALRRPK